MTSATYAIGPYWTDQCTGACFNVSGAGLGIFTSVSGSAPNRIFNIEWRTAYYNSGGTGVPLNYEVRLYERRAEFDVIYGTVNTFSPPQARNLSTGVQKAEAAGQFTLQGCDSTGGMAPPVSSGQLYHYTLTSTSCPAPSAPTGYLYALNQQNGSSNQIYGFSVNETTGALTALSGFPVGSGGNGVQSSPVEQLAIDTTNQRLYALNDGSDTVTAFAIDPLTGTLTVMPFSPISLAAGTWTLSQFIRAVRLWSSVTSSLLLRVSLLHLPRQFRRRVVLIPQATPPLSLLRSAATAPTIMWAVTAM